jgi:flavin-dependent dehydrogenase
MNIGNIGIGMYLEKPYRTTLLEWLERFKTNELIAYLKKFYKAGPS